MIKPANSWYSVVSVTPDPEAGERVNVAIVFQRGSHVWLEYDTELPRLACLVGKDEIEIYRSVLAAAQSHLPSELDVVTFEHFFGSHFKVSKPRPLFHEPTREVVRILKDKYLPKPGNQRKRHGRVQRGVAKRIDDVLTRVLPLNAKVEKKPTVDKLYPRAMELFESPVPALDRAIRVESKDLLIGGVIIDPSGALDNVRDRTARFSQAFWQYHHAKDKLADLEGREVRTLGVIFNGFGRMTPAVASAKEYVQHIWKQDADRVIVVSRPEDRHLLADEVHGLIDH